MIMSNDYTTLYYKDLDNKSNRIVIPTIQSLSIPDSTSIPSKPTVTGEYRNQYVNRNALKISFKAWLENGKFGEETVNVSEIIDKLEYIKKNRIKFNLSTTQESEESRFLTDLVIENISYSREADRRNRTVVDINCMEIKLVNLSWKLASSIEIFGQEIFTDTATGAKNVNMNFIAGVTDTDFELSINSVKSLLTKLGDVSGYTDMPVNRHIRNTVENYFNLDENSYYYKLASPIDMSIGTRSYNCACSFKSRYGLGSNDDDYTVDLGIFTVNITQNDVSIVENFPIQLYLNETWWGDMEDEALVKGSSEANAQRVRNNYSISPYPYDFADTYDGFNISDSFEHIAGQEEVLEYIYECYQQNKITQDSNAVTTGSIVVKNGYVYTYKICDRYDCSVNYGSVNKSLEPDGGLRIDICPVPDPEIVVSNDEYQELWDNLSPNLYLVTVCLGSQLQLFLFSASLFSQERISSSA